MSVDDQEYHIKQRIAKWLKTQPRIYGDYYGGTEDEDIEDLMLRFYRQLAVWEAERQSA